MSQKTTIIKPCQASSSRAWHQVDARDQVLGRMATRVATLLRGKHKVDYAGSVDCGDFVVVINAKNVRLTGDKLRQKQYFSHSGYAGGAKVTPLWRVMEKDPRKVVALAVRRMLPDNRLRARQMTRLRIFVDDQNPFMQHKAKS
ncbi:MAG: 50S ribosomal protein L13 [Elusimicrobia bacterium]|nr:50S ribosomal protein L13 [Elusimicrobiota bacterium]